MRHFTTLTAAALIACATIATANEAENYQTAMSKLTVLDQSGDRHLQGFLWYPTLQSEGVIRAHGNQVWEAIKVIPDAEPIAGKKPLLLLSHGMFGNSRNQAWLAQALTAKGYIVAAIDHPGTSSFQRDPDHRRELWERPRDITRTIDHLLAEPKLSQRIDQSRIFMAGHSLGGFTAVALAGGRIDPDRFDASCAANPNELVCGIFDDWNVGKTPEDRAALSEDLSDSRISGFAVFDLGGTQTFSPASLAAIDRDMFVIGAPLDISGIDLDNESRALTAALAADKVTYSEPESLAHFDFLGVCTPNALAILKEEEPEDVFVCEDGIEQRKQEHDAIAENVAQFFAGL